jgi:cytochrome b
MNSLETWKQRARQLMADCRIKAEELIKQGKPINRVAAIFIVAVWLMVAALVMYGILCEAPI